MGSLPCGCIRQMLGTEETFHLAIQEPCFLFFKKKKSSMNVVSDLSNCRSVTLMWEEKMRTGEDVVTHFLRCSFIFGPSLRYCCAAISLGTLIRRVTITAERARSDFGFEMHHGSLSLSTKETASSCCHSNVQNKCDTVGERAGELSSESHQRLRLNVVLWTSKANAHKT